MRIVVLFNLLPSASPDAYELWARTSDLPAVNALASVKAFDVYRTTGLLGGGTPPYAYIEIIDVPDMAAFGVEAADEAIAKVAAEFRTFADAPLFVTTEAL